MPRPKKNPKRPTEPIRRKVEALIDLRGVDHKALADRAGITEGKLWTFLNQTGGLFPHEVFEIGRAFGVSSDWLIDTERGMNDPQKWRSSTQHRIDDAIGLAHEIVTRAGLDVEAGLDLPDDDPNGKGNGNNSVAKSKSAPRGK